MRRVVLFLILSQISLINKGQIIADHTIVADFNKIPQTYIDLIKKMWVTIPGESHSGAYRTGLTLLEASYPAYQVNVMESGPPEAYTEQYLRISRATWGDVNNSSGWIYSYGEEDWFTSATAISRTKAGITYCNTHSLTLAAIGFGWCWDVGIKNNDYLSGTQEYIDYCTSNGYTTKVFFTTGTVDSYTGETGYTKHLNYESTRTYVAADASRTLFDYADILCYDDDGTPNTTTWNGHTYPIITTTNLTPTIEAFHISNAGAIRLAKAMWWMLARMAGWDGVTTTTVPVTGITVTGAGGATTITTDNGTLQLSAAVTPSNATNKAVTWTIANGTGQASISASGLVTAIASGTVTAKATANDGTGVYGTLVITISNQVVPVTGITVTGAGGATTIKTDNGTLQLSAAITPSNATNKTVTWTIANGTGQASISASGLVTAIASGTVTARATATDGSGVSGTLVITISSQVIPVSGILVTGAGGATTITTDNETLQLSAAITPSNATNKTVTWSISYGTGQASISASGLVTAIASGTVTAKATANDGSGVYGTLLITISNQVIPVTGITVTGAGGATTIPTDNGTLQLSATITPTNATNQTVTWSLTNGTGEATINFAGLVTAIANGTVTARATANDGSGVSGTLVINISSQVIPVTGITVTGAGGATTITTDNGTLQLSAAIIPSNATNKTVTWTIANGTGQASINTSGLVTAIANGTVTAIATANDGSGVYGTLVITISNQIVPVKSITVTGSKGATEITSYNGTLQLNAAISPSNATNQTVTWSIINGTGQASISASGLVTAIANGTVTARATANDGSGIYGTMVITISNQIIHVTGITLTSSGGATTITTDNGTLQLSAAISPSNATNQEVTWSVINGTGQASINATGVVTAISSGTVTAQATVTDGSGVTGTMDIIIIKRNITDPLVVFVNQNEMRFPLDESYLTCKISLYDLNGNLMRARLVDSNICSFDISGFRSGLYIAVLSNNMILKVAKVIIP